MINEIRTLLRNRLPATATLGDIYVPEDYRPVSGEADAFLPNLLLFPGQDEITRNYCLSQLMTLVHQPDHAKYISNFDSRITYDPFSRYWMDRFISNPQWTFGYSSSVSYATLYAEADFTDPNGLIGVNLIQTYILQKATTSSITVQHSGDTQIYSVTFDSNGVSQWIELQPWLKIRMRSTTGTVGGDFRFILSVACNGKFDLLTILSNVDKQTNILRQWAAELQLPDTLDLYMKGLTVAEKVAAAAILTAGRMLYEYHRR